MTSMTSTTVPDSSQPARSAQTPPAVTIQDANQSLQLILSHQGHPTLPLVVTHLDSAHHHLIAISPRHVAGPPSPATVAAVANATTALLPIFLMSQSAFHSAPPVPATMVPWSSVSFDSAGAHDTHPWVLQAHGSLQAPGRRHAAAAGAAAAGATLASVDVFLVDARGVQPPQLLVSSRVPAAALPAPPMVARGDVDRAWHKVSRM